MKLKVFDVVELKNNDKAIVVNIAKNGYKIKLVDDCKIIEVEPSEIKKILYTNR